MKLRATIFLLCLVAILSTATGVYFYYTSVRKAVLADVKKEGNWHVELIANAIETHFSASLKAVKSLSGHKEIKKFLLKPHQNGLDDLNRILDNFNASFDASVTYLMDLNGITIASSNRNSPDSFVGRDYGFRPYFKEAMQGKPFLYMALGITSGKRGIYHSHPVFVGEKRIPSGVVVMKSSADRLEDEILNKHFGISGMMTLLVDPNGIIFMSDRRDYLFTVLKKVPKDKMDVLLEKKQFGEHPLKWSGFTEKEKNIWDHETGKEYLVAQKQINSLLGWKFFHLHDLSSFNQLVIHSFSGRFSWVAIFLCVILGIISLILYQSANQNLVRRQNAEKLQTESEVFLESLLSSIPVPVFYKDTEGRYQGFNASFENFFGKEKQELVGKSVFDISPKELAEIYHKKDVELFESGDEIQHYESKVQNAKNEIRDVIFDKSVYKNRQGEVAGLIGTIMDITQRKHIENEKEKLIKQLQEALAEIKDLQGIIPICSNCKKIRDDKGYWSQLESYFEKHTGADFSHSICPNCFDKLYGNEEWHREMKNKEKKE